jgi:hypothetical protein
MPRLIFQGEPVGSDFWLAAPYILVVKVARADLVGARQPVFRGGPKTLQLVRFTVNVEDVIQGNMPDKNISFYFFAKTDATPHYYLDPGKRYIVSLRREGGVWRSWADGSQLAIWVHSGSHAQKDLPLDLGPATTIAYILLTPGTDCNLKEFAGFLDWPPQGYGGPGYLNERLKELQHSPSQMVREEACLAMARLLWHQPKCLEECLHSPDGRVRSAAAKFKVDDVHLLELLRHNPSALFNKGWSDYISEMFEIYAEDMRPEVRKAACAALRSFDPQRAAAHCR